MDTDLLIREIEKMNSKEFKKLIAKKAIEAYNKGKWTEHEIWLTIYSDRIYGKPLKQEIYG